MNSFLAEFRIASAMEAGRPLPPRLQDRLDHAPDLQRFQRDLAAVEQALKSQTVAGQAPMELHQSILQAVRDRAGAEEPRHRTWLRPALGWGLAAASALILGVLFWPNRVDQRRATEESSGRALLAADAALAAGGTVTRDLPAQAIAPLAEEMQRLNRDVRHTVDFLLANVP
jgi:hypothetical protein